MTNGIETIYLEAAPSSKESLPIRCCVNALRAVTAAMLLLIMGLTFADVLLRYWFSAPLTGRAEMVAFAMATLVFAAFPLVTYQEQHISVSVLTGVLHGRVRWFQRLFVLIVSTLACGGMTWQLAVEGVDLVHDGMTTMVLEWPIAPLCYLMSGLAGIAFLGLALLLAAHVAEPFDRSRGQS